MITDYSTDFYYSKSWKHVIGWLFTCTCTIQLIPNWFLTVFTVTVYTSCEAHWVCLVQEMRFINKIELNWIGDIVKAVDLLDVDGFGKFSTDDDIIRVEKRRGYPWVSAG